MTQLANRHSWREHLAASLFYGLICIVFIGHGAPLTQGIMGAGNDPLQFVWFFTWWPWAVWHHIGALYSNLVWQPLGVPMMWATSVPLLSFAAIPLTLFGGPVLAYNLFILAAPLTSALAAYFLCLYVTKNFRAALLGGYLFGFSSYEMAADLASLNLSFTLFVPCLVLLALCRLNGDVGRSRAVLLASLMMVLQFLISIEIFATIVLTGFIAWICAFRTLQKWRVRLWTILFDAILAGPVILLALSPFLLSMLAHAHYVSLPAAWPYFFSADLLNFFLPTQLAAIGGQAATTFSRHFTGGLQEQDAYLGLPLIVILALFIRERWRTPTGGFLILLLVVFIVMSLGPHLWVDGTYTSIMLPWIVLLKLPLISSALPTRFALYVSLVSALMAALWVAAPDRQYRRFRLFAAGLAGAALIPAPHLWMKIPAIAFFNPGNAGLAALGAQPRLLVLPFASRGPSTYWQVQSHFGYSETGGYLGFPPAAMQRFAVVGQLFAGVQGPNFGGDLHEFCAATNTQYIIAGPGVSSSLMTQLRRLDWPARKVDDVTVFTVPDISGIIQ